MVVFDSYVKLPEGIWSTKCCGFVSLGLSQGSVGSCSGWHILLGRHLVFSGHHFWPWKFGNWSFNAPKIHLIHLMHLRSSKFWSKPNGILFSHVLPTWEISCVQHSVQHVGVKLPGTLHGLTRGVWTWSVPNMFRSLRQWGNLTVTIIHHCMMDH